MKAMHSRRILAALALVLLLGGCTLGRSGEATAPREQASAATLTADLQTLRQENNRLREQQRAQQGRIEELQRSLAQTQEEQRRFRESMTTNFDLLEQSVALTLSKTITADLSARASTGSTAPAMAQPAMTQPALAGQSTAALAEPSAPRTVVKAAPAVLATASSTATAPKQASAEVAPMTVAARDSVDRPEAIEDADLLPPAQPTLLTAHREAKPLYEKGFSLFARKDYDQAVIVFQNFLQRFPDDIYSDNAQFWIAESHLNLNRPAEAEQAYRAVLRNYEHRSTLEGYKTPDAIYRLGQLAQNRGDVRRTRHYYEVLGERFPDTSAGRKAVRELASLSINTAAR